MQLYPYRPTDYRSPDVSIVTDGGDVDDVDADIDNINNVHVDSTWTILTSSRFNR